MREIILNGEWEVKGFWPWVPLKGTSMEIGSELMGVTEWLPASVPGGVHKDLHAAGWIDHPYRDMNSLNCEWVENRWWVYKTVFEVPDEPGKKIELVCKGLDYEAIVMVNGETLGEHANMFVPAVFDVTEALRGRQTAELRIVLRHSPDEMGQIGKTSETFTQKSRFNYKWDFSTRLVNIGLWDEACLRVHEPFSFDEIGLFTDADEKGGRIEVKASISRKCAADAESVSNLLDGAFIPDGEFGACELEARIFSPSGEIVTTLRQPFNQERGSLIVDIPQPLLWFPNGYGEQPLYTVRLRLLDGDDVLDEQTHRTGIRRLEYRRNEGAPDDSLPYTFVVNGVPIYIRGANLTPLDHLYGNVENEKYVWMTEAAARANMNMLRVWGGGLIEKEILYEWCDRLGLLVWQEFIQSSSGIDNEPSKQPEFLEKLTETAKHALRTKRNHVSLAVWSGGNELMSEPDRPSTFADPNLAMLRELVAEHDPGRLFLPTSASGPVQYITREKGVSHDVHGHWKYEGNPAHYSLYGEADHLFHSEFGVDGVSSPRTLRKYLSEPHLKPTSMRDDPVWRHHGEWWDTYDRDTEMFGEFRDLTEFSRASQWMQAEGLRFILEANRRRQFRNSGSLVWQLNEPWPNAGCTNLIDYGLEPKMAYYWVKNAFAPNHAALHYRKLDYSVGETFEGEIFVFRDAQRSSAIVRAELLDTNGAVLASWEQQADEGGASVAELGMLRFEVPHTADGLFYVRLRAEDTEAKIDTAQADNLYVFSARRLHPYRSALDSAGAKLDAEALGEWREIVRNRSGERTEPDLPFWRRSYRVVNSGTAVALHVHPQEMTDGYRLLADDAYFPLFPGEEKIVTVDCAALNPDVFDAENDQVQADARQSPNPDIAFVHFSNPDR
ncbi:glycoside hydrolase family 2 protein [Saccharibacillus sacchari]|uniref:glycoside hydrolase family 2 protein n=1 Tax=Saccharibacillus sacchari TaxID=456493 RepID=UPI0004BB49A3|nr:glycoside hydrolase family 2 TIM barrel-domain containing protein [Saccharibacillus sacchari]